MKHDQDFSALQNLLAMKRDEIPTETQVNRFLIEFHRRQRTRLLQEPMTPWAYAAHWFQQKANLLFEKLSLGSLTSPLAYGSAFAALAVTCLLAFSPETAPSSSLAQADNDSSFSLRLNNEASTPTTALSLMSTPSSNSFHASANKLADTLRLTSTRFTTAMPQFVLVNTHAAYDAHAAF